MPPSTKKKSKQQTDTQGSASVSPDAPQADSRPTEPENVENNTHAQENVNGHAAAMLQSKGSSVLDARDVIRKYFYWDGCGLCEDDFVNTQSRDSTFNRYVRTIFQVFSTRWVTTEARREYIETFCFTKWHNLTDEQRKAHTITECVACASQYPEIQANFPLKPAYELSVVENVPPSTVDSISRTRYSVKRFLKEDFAEFNDICSAKTGKPFAEIA